VDIPTAAGHTKCSRAGVRDAVLAALDAGADGVVISRKYSEMRLENLNGVDDAVKSQNTQSFNLSNNPFSSNSHLTFQSLETLRSSSWIPMALDIPVTGKFILVQVGR
jgi:hypothetical protein